MQARRSNHSFSSLSCFLSLYCLIVSSRTFLAFRLSIKHAHMLKMYSGISITLLQDYQEDFTDYLWDQYSLGYSLPLTSGWRYGYDTVLMHRRIQGDIVYVC